MLKTLAISLAALAATSTMALACSPEDVQARQGPLVIAFQALVASNPTKAQAIIAKMQADLDKAAADGDEAATCVIMDEALVAARG